MPSELRSAKCVDEDAPGSIETIALPRSLPPSAEDSGRELPAVKQSSGTRRNILHFYLLQIARVWSHLPESIRRSSAGNAYGRYVHSVVCKTSNRQQYFATFFMRNRPELQMMCRLLDARPSGSVVNISVLACSKGAEVYSIMQTIRSARPDLQLRVHAVDISPEIVEFAERGVYSRTNSDPENPPGPSSASDASDVVRKTGIDQGVSILERLADAEMKEMFEVKGDRVTVRTWLREGITWLCGDASDPKLPSRLGLQDIVVANRFLCHMRPADAETCLRNIACIVRPGGHIFVSGIDLNVRTKVARSLGWKPIQELIREIHEGDSSLREGWPLEYWALEPFCEDRPDWAIRYASVFQVGEAQ
jgi:chemotaxis protein methyltransferase CheR